MHFRHGKLLAAAAVALGLLSGPLTTAQASTATPAAGPAPVIITPETTAAQAKEACDARLEAAREAGSSKPVACTSWAKPSAAELRAAITAWPTPNWCDDHGANNTWYVNRFQACGVFSSDVTVHDTRTGRVTGKMHYLAVGYSYSKRDIKAWAFQVELLQVSASGDAKGSSANGKGTCGGKCKVTETKFPSQAMGQNKEAVGQFFFDTTIQASPKGQRGEGQGTAHWSFTNPKWAGPTNEMTLPQPPVRCDNALPGTSRIGCVMPYIPEMVYAKRGEYPELAKHIEYAQNTKHLPGKHGTTKYLTRLTDKAKIRQNRDKACPSSRHRPAGKQCDEYPFASTWQGASTGGGKFNWRMINAKQNEEGGKALGRFYLYNRILEKDKFLVWIKP
ncbi:Deoxyribonuclease NucA/NucB [Streptomyces sp. 2231.1]|uniref:NucA/NucB deoxyribonuclease domain-containing protein n=1 Tax=Streptomyces sp. 2231.1 TaxID=1855347 RepID=UPI00089775BC|nr:NucA/NucB deoxyribonuclease domain-containing protein [Streptomyces sp. 2231.1]SEE65836.1 Deoxyribonuclease NucA/NucB [Streptomyces sp. 2231.1]